jgi:hypothetical protein
MSKPHIHHDLIVLWAKGSIIEKYFQDLHKWEVDAHLNWSSEDAYRVLKPPVISETAGFYLSAVQSRAINYGYAPVQENLDKVIIARKVLTDYIIRLEQKVTKQ